METKPKSEPRPATLSREEEAKLALEHTVVSRPMARCVCVFFLMTIVSVPVVQMVAKMRRQQPVLPALNTNTFIPEANDLRKFEDHLESESVVARHVIPQVQNVLAHLGVGTENAYLGRDGWMAYRPDFNYVTGPGFLEPSQLRRRALEMDGQTPVQSDPVAAIVNFKNQLAKRHIRLIVLPTPLKPMLEAQHFASGYETLSAPLQNPSYPEFLRRLREQQVMVCDPTQALFQSGQHGSEPQFLQTDTHWTPAAMQSTAAMLSSFINKFSPLPPEKIAYRQRPLTFSGRGDLAQMMKLPSSPAGEMFPPQEVQLEETLTGDGEPWKSSSKADVLLLGDSFSNIYSREAMGWGSGAGLAEQLSFRLTRPLDIIAINAGGSNVTRLRLRDELLRDPDRLKNTRIVIWQFAMRDLQSGNWPLIALPGPLNSYGNASKLTPSKADIVNRFRIAITKKVSQSDRDLGDPAQPSLNRASVLDGSRGWMFYLSDARYVTNHHFLLPEDNPQIEALVDFRQQLARRGIQLVVMPVPAKATIYPEMLGLDKIAIPQAPQNPSFGRYRKALKDEDIQVFDPTGTLLRQKLRIHSPLYMPTDSHWTFTGMDNTAARLADFIKPQLPEMPALGYTRLPRTVANITDISYMLQSQPGNPQGMLLQQTVQQVQEPGGEVWKATPSADILVMGDSFMNIYSHGGNWGKGAGFAEQLSYYLQRPVDLIAMDSGGINYTRRQLQRDMQQGHDRLAGKKIVIYEFASRYLMRRDWNLIQLPAGELSPGTEPSVPPAALPAGKITVRATVKARSEVPNAGTTPYPDLVMSLQLTNVQIVDSAQSCQAYPQDLLVYTWGLRNARSTSAVDWKVGQIVTLSLNRWAKVEENYGSYSRTELQDDSSSGLIPYWGVEAK